MEVGAARSRGSPEEIMVVCLRAMPLNDGPENSSSVWPAAVGLQLAVANGNHSLRESFRASWIQAGGRAMRAGRLGAALRMA